MTTEQELINNGAWQFKREEKNKCSLCGQIMSGPVYARKGESVSLSKCKSCKVIFTFIVQDEKYHSNVVRLPRFTQ